MPDWFLKWMPWLWAAMNALIGWGVWSVRQVNKGDLAATREMLKADDERIESQVRELNALHSKLDGRITAIERQVAELPTKADIARLEERVEGVGKGVDRVDEAVLRLEGYFLRRGVEGADR